MTEVELGLPITPVEGSLCFFGKIPGTYAANFDVHGSYWCGGKGKGWDDGDGMGLWHFFLTQQLTLLYFSKDAWNFCMGWFFWWQENRYRQQTWSSEWDLKILLVWLPEDSFENPIIFSWTMLSFGCRDLGWGMVLFGRGGPCRWVKPAFHHLLVRNRNENMTEHLQPGEMEEENKPVWVVFFNWGASIFLPSMQGTSSNFQL